MKHCKPCLCGRTRQKRYKIYEDGIWYTELRCKCGMRVAGKSEEEAVRYWNMTMDEAK